MKASPQNKRVVSPKPGKLVEVGGKIMGVNVVGEMVEVGGKVIEVDEVEDEVHWRCHWRTQVPQVF